KAGLGVLLGPTGGYLLGFVVAAYLVGKMVGAKPRPGFLWTVAAMVAGTAALYALGVAQLMVVAKLTVIKALAAGVVPFLIGDAIKIVLAALIAGRVRERIRV
ncbi:MAG: biotin transporter BioY, partial [Deltaproteobacteria bacterium]|nr:biotin transporter BioY [Deltaproteobacteria bacterium]